MIDNIGFVYIIRLGTGLYKIGRTKNIRNRHASFRTIDPKAKRIYVGLVEDYKKCEREVIKMLKKRKCKRHSRELFELTPEDIREVQQYLEYHRTLDRRFEGARTR